jgi:hypothetical protein
MKSSYELAMERLNKSAPSVKLSDAKKKELAELDTVYAAKVAERELFIKDELMKAREKGDYEAYQSLERQLVADKKNLAADLEEKKNKIREKKG